MKTKLNFNDAEENCQFKYEFILDEDDIKDMLSFISMEKIYDLIGRLTTDVLIGTKGELRIGINDLYLEENTKKISHIVKDNIELEEDWDEEDFINAWCLESWENLLQDLRLSEKIIINHLTKLRKAAKNEKEKS